MAQKQASQKTKNGRHFGAIRFTGVEKGKGVLLLEIKKPFEIQHSDNSFFTGDHDENRN
jgi:hypothetical protein